MQPGTIGGEYQDQGGNNEIDGHPEINDQAEQYPIYLPSVFYAPFE
jgi:hypothetical protein